MDTILILLAAAVVSAASVWWALAPTGDRRRVPRRASLRRTGEEPPREAQEPDRFVLLPSHAPSMPEDRPPRARAVILLVATIAIAAAAAVAALAIAAMALKAQLDRYFTGG